MKNTPKCSRTSITKAVESLLETGARQATVYQHPKLSIKATLRFRPDARNKRTDIVLTVGSPNYEGRAFVKKLVAAGEPFPVRKVQLKFWPKQLGKLKPKKGR